MSNYLGETLAILCALSWAFSFNLFRIGGYKVRPSALNLYKNGIGLILLILSFPLVGVPYFLNTSWEIYFYLLLSGIVGIGLADTLMFASLNRLGAGLSSIVNSIFAPWTILLAYLFLGEKLDLLQGLGTLLVLSGIVLASKIRWRSLKESKELAIGVFLGVLSMLLMAASLVFIKPILNKYPTFWTTGVRVFGGFVAIAIFSLFNPSLKKAWRLFKPQPIWKVIFPASVVGAYLAILLMMGSMKHAQVNIASILIETSSIYTVILASFMLKEKLTWQKVAGALLAICGIILIL